MICERWLNENIQSHKKVRNNAAEQQADVFEGSKVNGKYGVPGIAISNPCVFNRACDSHIFGQ